MLGRRTVRKNRVSRRPAAPSGRCREHVIRSDVSVDLVTSKNARTPFHRMSALGRVHLRSALRQLAPPPRASWRTAGSGMPFFEMRPASVDRGARRISLSLRSRSAPQAHFEERTVPPFSLHSLAVEVGTHPFPLHSFFPAHVFDAPG